MYDSLKVAKYNEFCSLPKEYSWKSDLIEDIKADILERLIDGESKN